MTRRRVLSLVDAFEHLGVVFYYEVFDDELLAFHGVFAHVEFEQFFYAVFFTQGYAVEAHVGADESAEFFG